MEKSAQARPLLFESGARGRRNRFSGAKVNPRRIARDAGNPELIVEMRPGGETSRAHISQDVALVNALSDMQPTLEALEMTVARDDTVGVTDLDQVPVASGPTHLGNHPVARRHHRSAGICRVVG